MADYIVDYASRSLAAFLEREAGFAESYIINPDFDWDKKPDPDNPKKRIGRSLPYAGVILVQDSDQPFTMSANILRHRTIDYHIVILGTTYSEMVQKTSNMKQAIVSAVTPITGGVGITLYDFAAASGSFYAQAGTMQVELAATQYFGAASQEEEGNRKYRSITPIMLSMFKDSTATLLENKGRISLTDS